jgi:hypothetical protein
MAWCSVKAEGQLYLLPSICGEISKETQIFGDECNARLSSSGVRMGLLGTESFLDNLAIKFV